MLQKILSLFGGSWISRIITFLNFLGFLRVWKVWGTIDKAKREKELDKQNEHAGELATGLSEGMDANEEYLDATEEGAKAWVESQKGKKDGVQ